MITLAHRYHDFSYGHRVVGHENKCSQMHGHNGRVTFYAEADRLDDVGRVIDFSVLKSRCCDWVEAIWDHKFLVWDRDPALAVLPPYVREHLGVVLVTFNPTAENMARYLLDLGPSLLAGTGARLVRVDMLETRKCGASVEINRGVAHVDR